MSKTVRVKRDGVSSFSFEGEEYRAGRDGSIEIPVEAIPAAVELGMTVVERRRKADDGSSE